MIEDELCMELNNSRFDKNISESEFFIQGQRKSAPGIKF